MSVEPVAINADLLAKVRDVAGPDVAAFVEAAIEAALREQEFGRILDELDAEAGPLADDLRAEAEAFWHAG